MHFHNEKDVELVMRKVQADHAFNQENSLNMHQGDYTPIINDLYLHDYRFYYKYFNKLPNVYVVTELELEKAIAYFKENYRGRIIDHYFKKEYNRRRKRYEYSEIFFILDNDTMVSFNEGFICRVMNYKPDHQLFEPIVSQLRGFKIKRRKKPNEINLITVSANGLDLSRIDINRTKLNLASNYNDDFLPVHKLIFERLNRKNDKGIVLLHGMPGTGKTTYLRYLIGLLKKPMLFVPPNIAANMANPDFVNILVDNPNSVLVIEDAENIIMDRGQRGSSAVSTLLNISDGLLSDCLNIQIICTFNMPITNIDEALLRKGRLIAKYEFKELGVAKAQALSDSLGFNTQLSKPTALSDIYNQQQPDFKPDKAKIGF
ncbi:MAG: AAA family ATPase [Bernardetiaceae bacterium]|nr:AAA family ATPase [Bernardetiaceae bacterium]